MASWGIQKARANSPLVQARAIANGRNADRAGVMCVVVAKPPNESRISCVVRRPRSRQTDLFPFKRPPRHDSFMRWLGGILWERGSVVHPLDDVLSPHMAGDDTIRPELKGSLLRGEVALNEENLRHR